MYSANGIFYTEEHSLSFGDLYVPSGESYTDFNIQANTWTDWHLIPSSRPAIMHPSIVTKYIEIPGADGALDLTDYLRGRPNYGQRQGAISFVVANGIEYWESIREKMVRFLHGKRIKMRLEDDPGYYYEGRFTVGNWESGASNSSISISYQLDPYKIKINTEGTTPSEWDTFNFNSDYDYYTTLTGGSNSGSYSAGEGTYYIYSNDYVFQPIVTWVSGSGTVSFGGMTETMNAAGTRTLGFASIGQNTLTITGSLQVTVEWRGGSL